MNKEKTNYLWLLLVSLGSLLTSASCLLLAIFNLI